MSRPIRQSALKARERIASYYHRKISSDRVSSEKVSSSNNLLVSNFLLVDRLSDLLDSIHSPTDNRSQIQHKLEVANEIYTLLLSNTSFLIDRDTTRNAIILTMTRNESELSNLMNTLFEEKHENRSLLESFEKSVKEFHHNGYKSSILKDLSTIKNKMYDYEQYIINMNESICEKIKKLRRSFNKK